MLKVKLQKKYDNPLLWNPRVDQIIFFHNNANIFTIVHGLFYSFSFLCPYPLECNPQGLDVCDSLVY